MNHNYIIMKHLKQILSLVLMALYLITLLTGCAGRNAAVIYIDMDADKSEELAAREIRKYVYQRTGELLSLKRWNSSDRIKGDAILVGKQSATMMKSTGYSFPELVQDAFILKTIPSKSISDDFEYYLRIDAGKEYHFPASAPLVNNAVVQIKD